MYWKLILSGLIPVALSVLFYLLKKFTKFNKLSNKWQQVIIGVAFGLAAICGTEFGVPLVNAAGDVTNATASARDAAPLCAGLFFGGPAGIIAGCIGGVERFIATYWGRGAYSQVACSLATIFAGFYAAILRKYMFEDKRPNAVFGVATALVTEILHMTILFLTHLNDTTTAMDIVKMATIPMVVANCTALFIACLVLDIISYDKNKIISKYSKLNNQIQGWLFLVVIVGYLFTTSFVYTILTGDAKTEADQTLLNNIQDAEKDVKNEADTTIYDKLVSLKDDYYEDSREEYETSVDPARAYLKAKADEYEITEIHVIGLDGIIKESTVEDYVGFDMSSTEQSKEFNELLKGEKDYLIQEFRQKGVNDNEYAKYAGYVLDGNGEIEGYIQIGYSSIDFHYLINEKVEPMARFRRVGLNGYIIIADETQTIVADGSELSIDKTLSEIGLDLSDKKYSTSYELKCNEISSRIMYDRAEGYYVITVMSTEEVYLTRDGLLYINTFMEVIVFALLFAIIYNVTKKLVCEKLLKVNEGLADIISGKLDTVINVRSSNEFSNLSNYINSTVVTLKKYIADEAARIDKELAFAKNIQLSTLPNIFPAYPSHKEFNIYATINTAKEVGGDFYDFFWVGKTKLAFLIADVSGKGIPAAMFMMQAKTTIKNLALTGLSVEETIYKANNSLCQNNEAGMFVTCWMGILETETGKVTFTNAGHNTPLIYRKGHGFEYLPQKKNLVLAGLEEAPYVLQTIQLNPGDLIYLYTDGVTEATRSDNVLYGEDRLKGYLNNNADKDFETLLKGIQTDINNFIEDAPQFDDITMLILGYYGKEE